MGTVRSKMFTKVIFLEAGRVKIQIQALPP